MRIKSNRVYKQATSLHRQIYKKASPSRQFLKGNWGKHILLLIHIVSQVPTLKAKSVPLQVHLLATLASSVQLKRIWAGKLIG